MAVILSGFYEAFLQVKEKYNQHNELKGIKIFLRYFPDKVGKAKEQEEKGWQHGYNIIIVVPELPEKKIKIAQ
jgi:hypothetical protein